MSKNFLPRIKLLPRHTLSSPSPLSRYRKLAAAIAQILQTRNTNPQWEESLTDLLPADEEDISPVLICLHDPDSAFALFSWIRHRPFAASPDSASYSTLLRLLAIACRFQESELVLETMLTEGKTPTREALSVLVGSYARSGLQDKALSIYLHIQEKLGSLPYVSDCNRLLYLLIERGRLETALQVYDEMLKKDDGANNFSTGIMVKGLCMRSSVDDARKLMMDRWGRSCVPDVIFYNMLIDGYMKCGNARMCYILFREMKMKGFLPTVSTYGAIINDFCRKGDFRKVEKLMTEMKARGLDPNAHIYNSVIDARCKHGSFLEAKVVLKRMIASGCQPDIVTYNILISGYCQYRSVGEAESLLRKAIKQRLVPNVLSYTPLIHSYCQEASVTSASRLLNQMMEMGIMPDLVTFGALIHGLVATGDVQAALTVREKMEERGVTSDAGVYNVLMSGFFKKGMLSSAQKLLSEMLDRDVMLDEFVYATLIDGFSRNGDLNNASKVFQLMGEKGVKHGVVVYNALIKGHCRAGLLNEAVMYIDRMRKEGYIPDAFTYTTVIDGYARQCDMDGASKVFGDMAKHKCKPNVVTYSALINGFCKRGDLDSAVSLLREMQSHGVVPNVVTYSLIIGGLCKMGKVVNSAAFFEEMLHFKCIPNDFTFRHLISGLLSCRQDMDFSSDGYSIVSTEFKMTDMFKKMISDGWDHMIAAYNAIIFCLCKHQMLMKALELRDRMLKQGYLPDSVTVLLLLHVICAQRKSHEWKNILSGDFEVKESELTQKYMHLVDQHINNGKPSEASCVLSLFLNEVQRLPKLNCRITVS